MIHLAVEVMQTVTIIGIVIWIVAAKKIINLIVDRISK